jgi:hypothetical protein
MNMFNKWCKKINKPLVLLECKTFMRLKEALFVSECWFRSKAKNRLRAGLLYEFFEMYQASRVSILRIRSGIRKGFTT